MKHSNDDARLRELLHEWSDVPAPETNLAHRVQTAVSQAADHGVAGPRASWWKRWQTRLGCEGSWFRFACASVVLGVLVGIVTVEWRRSRGQADMSAHYLRWIAPASQVPAGEIGRS